MTTTDTLTPPTHIPAPRAEELPPFPPNWSQALDAKYGEQFSDLAPYIGHGLGDAVVNLRAAYDTKLAELTEANAQAGAISPEQAEVLQRKALNELYTAVMHGTPEPDRHYDRRKDTLKDFLPNPRDLAYDDPALHEVESENTEARQAIYRILSRSIVAEHGSDMTADPKERRGQSIQEALNGEEPYEPKVGLFKQIGRSMMGRDRLNEREAAHATPAASLTDTLNMHLRKGNDPQGALFEKTGELSLLDSLTAKGSEAEAEPSEAIEAAHEPEAANESLHELFDDAEETDEASDAAPAQSELFDDVDEVGGAAAQNTPDSENEDDKEEAAALAQDLEPAAEIFAADDEAEPAAKAADVTSEVPRQRHKSLREAVNSVSGAWATAGAFGGYLLGRGMEAIGGLSRREKIAAGVGIVAAVAAGVLFAKYGGLSLENHVDPAAAPTPKGTHPGIDPTVMPGSGGSKSVDTSALPTPTPKNTQSVTDNLPNSGGSSSSATGGLENNLPGSGSGNSIGTGNVPGASGLNQVHETVTLGRFDAKAHTGAIEYIARDRVGLHDVPVRSMSPAQLSQMQQETQRLLDLNADEIAKYGGADHLPSNFKVRVS